MDDIRELCWKGNLIGVRQLIERQGVDVNDKHAMNGTTRTKLFFLISSFCPCFMIDSLLTFRDDCSASLGSERWLYQRHFVRKNTIKRRHRGFSLSNAFLSYLISHGANPDGKDSKGVTPRDLAAEAPNSIRRELGLPDIAGSSLFLLLALPLVQINQTLL